MLFLMYALMPICSSLAMKQRPANILGAMGKVTAPPAGATTPFESFAQLGLEIVGGHWCGGDRDNFGNSGYVGRLVLHGGQSFESSILERKPRPVTAGFQIWSRELGKISGPHYSKEERK